MRFPPMRIGPDLEGDFAGAHRCNALIADGRAVRIATQVVQHLRRPAQGRFGIHHPVMPVKLPVTLAPGARLPLRVAFNLSGLARVSQRRHELAPKYPGQRVHRKQEGGLARGR